MPLALFAPCAFAGNFKHALPNLPESAPTILVMPTDHHVHTAQFAPPLFKLSSRNVESSRRNQMIEHDQMLLAPAKRRDRAEVVVIEKILAERRSAAVQWSIDQLRRQKYPGRRNLRQVQQRALVNARRDFFTDRIHESYDPLVVLGAVNPRRHMPAGYNLRRQREEPVSRIGKMMQDADRKRVIKLAPQR